MEDLSQKLKKQFFEEVFGFLKSSEVDLVNLKKEPGNIKIIESLYRAMHTIKGTSAMYGNTHISDFTQYLEDIFQSIRETKTSVDTDIIDTAFEAIEHIRCLMYDENLSNLENISRNVTLLEKINKYFLSKNKYEKMRR